jgi:hypothetical protein
LNDLMATISATTASANGKSNSSSIDSLRQPA